MPEVAARLRVSRATAYRLIDRGGGPLRGDLRITEADLSRYLTDHRLKRTEGTTTTRMGSLPAIRALLLVNTA